MNLENKKIAFFLPITLFTVFFFPVIVPSLHIMTIPSFLILLFYKKSRIVCLWIAFFFGFLLDLLSFEVPFGFHAIIYCFTTFFLYGQKRHFFADSFSALPLMTYFFSILVIFQQAIFLYLIDKPIHFSWFWIITDIFIMPALDAFYGFIVFILPSLVVGKIPRSGRSYFNDKIGHL